MNDASYTDLTLKVAKVSELNYELSRTIASLKRIQAILAANEGNDTAFKATIDTTLVAIQAKCSQCDAWLNANETRLYEETARRNDR